MGGREQRHIVLSCNLSALTFGPEAPGEHGERLLQAQAQDSRDDIRLLASEVLSVLGPSPSGYSSRLIDGGLYFDTALRNARV